MIFTTFPKCDDVEFIEFSDGYRGDGEEIKRRLTNAGYDYYVIQRMVNDMLQFYTVYMIMKKLISYAFIECFCF